MLAVVGHPRDHWAFDRGRAEDRQRRANRTRGLERAMGEQPMKADRHAETGERVQQQEHEDVVPAEQAVPQLPASEEQAEDRGHSHDPGDDPIATLVEDRLDVVGNGSYLVLTGHRLVVVVRSHRPLVRVAVSRAAGRCR
jgi:hypothetical protein